MLIFQDTFYCKIYLIKYFFFYKIFSLNLFYNKLKIALEYIYIFYLYIYYKYYFFFRLVKINFNHFYIYYNQNSEFILFVIRILTKRLSILIIYIMNY